MAIFQECPTCKKKQSNRHKECKACGENLDRAKRSGRVKFHIRHNLPDGRRVQKVVGYSLSDARAADGKRKAQKKENRIFDMLPESKITFQELTDWYLELPSVNRLKTFERVAIGIERFNESFGKRMVMDIRQSDLEAYQGRRLDKGITPRTIDMELSLVKTMVTKASDNDKVTEAVVKPFRVTKKLLKKGSNARTRTVTVAEYLNILEHAANHVKAAVIIGYNTGMRAGEIFNLQWEHINRERGFIILPPDMVKEGREKHVPINHHVVEALGEVPQILLNDYVITYRGESINNHGGFQRGFKAACCRAKVPYGRKVDQGMTFHDLRRTVKTNMLKAGVDKVYRDTILGHSIQGMDRYYIVPTDKDLSKAMEKYTKWVDLELKKGDQMGD